MKVYKDGHMKIFSPYIYVKKIFSSYISKNILDKELTRDITHFPVLVKNILNILRHTKNNSVQNQAYK